jgi:hypothetical protein
VGETVQLTVVARDQFGDVIAGRAATWSTSDALVATISPNGLLRAVAPGAVVATATIDSVPGSLTLTVVQGSVASVSVSAPTLTPKEGDAVQLSATARDQFGNVVPGVTATWSVSDATLAAISATGLLQTYATGTVQARATVAGVTGAASLTVSAIKVSVTFGAKEVVYDYTTDHCPDLVLPGKPPLVDSPDQPTRFVRAEDGSLVLLNGLYLSRGKDFGSLKRDCSQPPFVTAYLSTPESYENDEMLWAVYREGDRWHGLVHNEFHDPVASTCRPGDSSPSNPCWYNSITYALSTDGGRSFSKPFAPAHVVAPAPNAWVPPTQQASYYYSEGYFSPSNIVRANDGYYYAVMSVTPFPLGPGGWCAMRTPQLGDPASWRAWDGTGFNLRMTSPYVTGSAAPVCQPMQKAMASGHLVYSTYIGRYVQVAQSQQWIGGRKVCGIYFSLSSDLVHWSEEQLLAETNAFDDCPLTPTDPGVLETKRQMYSSIIDHGDTTINFERTGRNAHLYYTRINDGGLDRDIVRVPITFTRVD